MNNCKPSSARRHRILPTAAVVALACCGCLHSQGRLSSTATEPVTRPSANGTAGEPETLRRARELEARAYSSNRREDFRAAAAALAGAARLRPDDLKLRQSLGYMYLDKLDDPARAYPHLLYVVRTAPQEPGWDQMLARAAASTGRRKQAIELYRRIIARSSENVWDRLALAKVLVAEERYDEAEELYLAALKVEPQNEFVNLAYGEFLMARGRWARARVLAEQVLARTPRSPGAHSLLGELYRTDWNFPRARSAYATALEADPEYYTAREGLRQIEQSRSPKLTSVFYYFEDTEDLEQSGLFNSLSLSPADRVFLDASFNVRWFGNDSAGVSMISRLEEGLGLEYRFSKAWAARTGVSAFETEDADDEVGFTAGLTWVPHPIFYAYVQYRENDPVNDSIFTVQRSFTQDVLGGGAGVQLSPRWSLSAAANTADYSDGNEREYLKAEVSYRALRDPLTYLRLEYELIDYERRDPDYSSPPGYDFIRPIIEVEPRLTPWLSIQARFEVPYVMDEADWGTAVLVGPVIKLGEDFELRATYLHYDLPGEFAPYSGEGFRVFLSYRF